MRGRSGDVLSLCVLRMCMCMCMGKGIGIGIGIGMGSGYSRWMQQVDTAGGFIWADVGGGKKATECGSGFWGRLWGLGDTIARGMQGLIVRGEWLIRKCVRVSIERVCEVK